MSFGHAHHVHTTREGERNYDRALKDARFQAVLNRGFRVSYNDDVTYLGGYSQDGSTIYVDRHCPAKARTPHLSHSPRRVGARPPPARTLGKDRNHGLELGLFGRARTR